MARTLQTPTINKITPVSPIISFDVTFQYKDNQAVKNRAVITDTETYSIIYDATQIGMKLSHTVPANTLAPGKRYIIQIQVFDEDGNSSLLSDQMSFYCYTTPSFSITNLTNDMIIKNASVTPAIEYSQTEGETIANFQFILYDYSKMQINTSPIYYQIESNSYTFYSLDNNTVYYIRAIGETSHGITLSTDYIKVNIRYASIPANAVFIAENVYDSGYVHIQSNIADVGYIEENCTISDGVLIIENGSLAYNEGFEVNGNFYFRLSIEKIPIGTFFKTNDNIFTLSLIEVCGEYYIWLKSGRYNLCKPISQVTKYTNGLYGLTSDGYIFYLEVICENGIFEMRTSYLEVDICCK